MVKPTIIGFMGKAGAGKTTAAKALQEKYPNDILILSFAAPLKAAVSNLFLFSPEQVFGNLKGVVDPRWGFTPREAMQKIGTDCVRHMLLEDFWVLRMKEMIKLNAEKIIIIDDVRFSNEAQLVISEGNTISRNVLISRPGAGGDSHISEQVPEAEADEAWANSWSLTDYINNVQSSALCDMIGRVLACR